MRKQALLFFALLWVLSPLCRGQGIFIPAKTVFGTVNGITRPISGATVTVCAANSAGIPCAPALANTVFKDSALTVPLANPFTTDANGNYPQAAMAGGIYTITESASGFAGFSYQTSVACTPGTGCTFSGPFTVNGALTASSVNTSVYVAPGGNIQTAINGLPSGGGEVLLSPGLYPITSAIIPKNGTHIRCTNTGWANTYDTAGCVIQPASGNAIFAVSGPAAGTMYNFKLTDVTIDLTADSSGLGCVNMVRSLYSEIYDVRCLLPTTGGMDGFRWDGTAFSYWGACENCRVVSTAPGAITNTHNAFHWTAAANSNWCVGCTALLVNNAFLIDGATSQVGIFQGGSDHFAGNCISIQGTARGNAAYNVRCEESFQVPTGAACNLGASVLENRCEHLYVVGAPNAAAVVTDSSGGKNFIYMDDTSGVYTNVVWGNASENFQFGLNKTPTQALDVHGRFNIDNFIFETANGGFRLDGNTNAGGEVTVLNCDATDTCRLSPTGAGGVYFATTGGASALGFQPNSFGNAFVPASDNSFSLGANTRRFSDLRFAGNIKPGTDAILISSTAPTIAAGGCGGSAAAVTAPNGTGSFEISTGTAPTTACTITMPAATTSWSCDANHVSAVSTTNFIIQQTGAISTTSVVLTLFSDVAAATNYQANDTLRVKCAAN